MIKTEDCKPEIVYPCRWVYKLIGRDINLLQSAVREVLTDRTYSAVPSKSSKAGAYHCLDVEMTVRNEPDRLACYEQFRRHPAVILVL